MFKRVIVGVLVALTLVGAGIAIGRGANGDWGRHHDAVVISGSGTGAAGAGQTIVVSDGHGAHGFFFPFGLLFFALFVFVVVSAFRRGGREGGTCRPGGPGGRGGPPWLEDWHRRAHESDTTTHAEGPSPA